MVKTPNLIEYFEKHHFTKNDIWREAEEYIPFYPSIHALWSE